MKKKKTKNRKHKKTIKKNTHTEKTDRKNKADGIQDKNIEIDLNRDIILCTLPFIPNICLCFF